MPAQQTVSPCRRPTCGAAFTITTASVLPDAGCFSVIGKTSVPRNLASNRRRIAEMKQIEFPAGGHRLGNDATVAIHMILLKTKQTRNRLRRGKESFGQRLLRRGGEHVRSEDAMEIRKPPLTRRDPTEFGIP